MFYSPYVNNSSLIEYYTYKTSFARVVRIKMNPYVIPDYNLSLYPTSSESVR